MDYASESKYYVIARYTNERMYVHRILGPENDVGA